MLTILAVMVTGCAGSNSAKPASGQKLPAYTCQRTSGPVTIDAKLDEPAWRHAQVIDRFYSLRPGDDPPFVPTADTPASVRLLYDDQHIYLGAQMRDPDVTANPHGADPKRTRESIYLDGDVIELFLVPHAPGQEPSYYYEIHVYPTGALCDLRIIASDYMGWIDRIADWNSGATAKVQIQGTMNVMDTDEGWTVEMAIPLKSLISGRPSATQPASLQEPWRFAVCMYDFSWQNVSENGSRQTLRFIGSVPFQKLDFHRRGDYQAIEFEPAR
jgi:hypothetical protein